MAVLKSITLASLALAIGATAQSANPGVGKTQRRKVQQKMSPQAPAQTEKSSSEDWLNTGITTTGWNPPFLSIDDVYTISLQDFYNGIGSACAQYDGYFQSSAFKYGVNPVVLAVIAMQESSCNANAGGPTPGLMQVSCDNYPNGQCTDSIQDNVDAGTHYLKSQLDASGGNAIKALGAYNGWFTSGSGLNGNRGLTQDYPCSAEGKAHGMPQNLDYLHQVLNGWMMGLDVYGEDNWVGTYHCDQSCGDGSLC